MQVSLALYGILERDKNMEWEEREEKLVDYFNLNELKIETKPGLDNALYSLSEHSLWPDSVDSVSKEQAIICWRIIEKLKKEEFPSKLCM